MGNRQHCIMHIIVIPLSDISIAFLFTEENAQPEIIILSQNGPYQYVMNHRD